MVKCVKCGAVLKQYNDKKTGWYFYPNLQTGFPRKRSNYTFKYRMVCNARYGNRKHRMVCISMDTDKYNAALCIDCYIQELKKALYAAEDLAGKIHNDIEPQDDETEISEQEIEDSEDNDEEPQDEQPKKQNIDVPSAEEIRKQYPEWVKRVIEINGKDISDSTLQDVFKMARRNGYV